MIQQENEVYCPGSQEWTICEGEGAINVSTVTELGRELRTVHWIWKQGRQ